MPAPSDLAMRLADDLVEVGKILGFEAQKEQPISEGSKFRVDVFWKMRMPAGSPFSHVNIASIEIQYSDSPTSISHGIFKAEKTLHPAIHFVISYYKLTDDYKENVLKSNYPHSGLVIRDGEEEVRKLNLWITRFSTIKSEESKLTEKGTRIREFAISQLPDVNETQIKERILENFQSEIKEVFLPPEITSLLETFVEIESRGPEYDRTIIDDVFASFIEFVQSKLEDYNIPRISVSKYLLFTELNIESEFSNYDMKFHDVEIEQSELIIRDANGYPYSVSVENGNAYIESEAGVVCKEGLNSEDLIHFITNASEQIEKQINRYRISEEDRKKLDAIRKVLN